MVEAARSEHTWMAVADLARSSLTRFERGLVLKAFQHPRRCAVRRLIAGLAD
jgi:hypothetical protein